MDVMSMTQKTLVDLMHEKQLGDELVSVVNARTLSANEAIGAPERSDYPIQKGREVMVEATFKGFKGQAFTDQPGTLSGTLREILGHTPTSNFERAVFIATANAVLRSLGKIDKTIHCRDKEPGICAKQLVHYVRERFGKPKIAFIGLQPGMVAELSQTYEMRVVDLDQDNIGKRFASVVVEPPANTAEMIEWSDIVLATGSTAVNDSLQSLIGSRPIVFYGVTVSGLAYINGLEQYCHCGH